MRHKSLAHVSVAVNVISVSSNGPGTQTPLIVFEVILTLNIHFPFPKNVVLCIRTCILARLFLEFHLSGG